MKPHTLHRQTQNNGLSIFSITECNLQAVLLSPDVETTFDLVNWLFLKSVLSKFNFHAKFIQIIQNIYYCPSARIKINGDLSGSFTLGRGTRQGCPLSPLLFALFIEPLEQWIGQNSKIKGIYWRRWAQSSTFCRQHIGVFKGSNWVVGWAGNIKNLWIPLIF